MLNIIEEINKELVSISNSTKLLNDLQNKNIFSTSDMYLIKSRAGELLNCMQKLEYINSGTSKKEVIKTLKLTIESIQGAVQLLRDIQSMESSLSASSLYRIKLNATDLARAGRKLQSLKATLENQDTKNQ